MYYTDDEDSNTNDNLFVYFRPVANPGLVQAIEDTLPLFWGANNLPAGSSYHTFTNLDVCTWECYGIPMR